MAGSAVGKGPYGTGAPWDRGRLVCAHYGKRISEPRRPAFPEITLLSSRFSCTMRWGVPLTPKQRVALGVVLFVLAFLVEIYTQVLYALHPSPPAPIVTYRNGWRCVQPDPTTAGGTVCQVVSPSPKVLPGGPGAPVPSNVPERFTVGANADAVDPIR